MRRTLPKLKLRLLSLPNRGWQSLLPSARRIQKSNLNSGELSPFRCKNNKLISRLVIGLSLTLAGEESLKHMRICMKKKKTPNYSYIGMSMGLAVSASSVSTSILLTSVRI
jgi:hypothetical protein